MAEASGTMLLPLDVAERALARLERWTAISSASGDLDGTRRFADAVAAEGEALGLLARRDDSSGAPLLELESPALSDRPLQLVGHLDTVLEAAPSRRDGDRFVATGAIDMKGGLVALFGALELLRSRRGRSALADFDLRLSLSPDEEVGGALSRAVVERRGAAARAFWVLEPGERTRRGETIVVGRRGLFHWTLDARGRAAHSGAQFWKGRSAAAAAAEWCVEAAALSRPQAGPTVNVARIVAGDAGFVDALGAHAERLGTAREVNVVPDRARVDGEARFVRADEEGELDQALRDAARRIGRASGVRLDYRRGDRIAPVDASRLGGEWPERAIALAAAAGWTLEIEPTRGGVSFPNFLPEPGAIPVLDGLGPVGGGMHTREEYVEIPSLERRVALLADLLEAERESAGRPAAEVSAAAAETPRARARRDAASTSR